MITAAIKKYTSVIKKKKKKHDKIVLLAKSKLNTIENLISRALIDTVISHDEFLWINVLKEYNKMQQEIKNFTTSSLIKDFSQFVKQCYHIIVWNVEKIHKGKIQKLQVQKTEE